LSVAFNDVDFCLKVDEAGYRNLWTPYAELYHYESISRGTDEDGDKKIRFDREIQKMTETWGSRLNNDPYYNPHLTKIHENFEIHVP
jgi:GT2 family glycosyltransferase